MSHDNAEPTQVPTIVFEPFKMGVPHIGTYLRRVLVHRRFAYELARSTLKGRHMDTVFGQAWNLLNPILLGVVYWVLISFIRGGSSGFTDIVFLLSGLFAFYFSRNIISGGGGSIVGGGGLLLNSGFPRLLMPFSALCGAALNHCSALLAYSVFHVIAGFPIGPQLLWLPLIIVLQAMISFGIALLIATATVYFRDTSSFLAYIIRIWLYLSPVLFLASEIPEFAFPWVHFNPLFDVLDAWQQVVVVGVSPSATSLGLAAITAVVWLGSGLTIFIAREREFALFI